MNKMTFPLKQRIQGSAVSDLQDALQLFLNRSALLRDDETLRLIHPLVLRLLPNAGLFTFLRSPLFFLPHGAPSGEVAH